MKYPKSFQHLLERVKHNDARYHVIDVSSFQLTENQLEQLNTSFLNNSVVSNIIWGSNNKEPSAIKTEIERKVIANFNANYKIVTPYMHALLCKHVNGNASLINTLSVQLPYKEEVSLSEFGWKVLNVFDHDPYFGVAYINQNMHHIILAHREMIFNPLDLISKNSAIKENIDGVLGKKLVSQQLFSYVALKNVTSWVTEQQTYNNSYTISTTGYGIGAWLAEHSVYFYLQDGESQAKKEPIKIVDFDGPGTFDSIANIQDGKIIDPDDEIYKKLDITSYLAQPNLINSCNLHIRKAYALQVNITKPQVLEKLQCAEEFIGYSNRVKGASSLIGHNLDLIIQALDPQTGPLEFKQIERWPVITVNDLKSSSVIMDYIKDVFNVTVSTIASWAAPTLWFWVKPTIEKYLKKYTFFSVASVLEALITGKVKFENYDKAMQSLDGDTYTLSKDLPADVRFKLKFGTYSVVAALLELEIHRPFDEFARYVKQHSKPLGQIMKCSANVEIYNLAELLPISYVIKRKIEKTYIESSGVIDINLIHFMLIYFYDKVQKTYNSLQYSNMEKLNIPIHFALLPLHENNSPFVQLKGTNNSVNFCRHDLKQTFEWRDLDDDGKADLICNSPKHGYYALFSNGIDVEAKTATLPIGILYASTASNKMQKLNAWCPYNVATSHFIDFNGDGLQDLVCSFKNCTQKVMLFNGSGFASPNENTDGALTDFTGKVRPLCTKKQKSIKTHWGDFNGDGMDDALCSIGNGQYYVFLSDGKVLVRAYGDTWFVYSHQSQAIVSKWCANNTSPSGEAIWRDINGDNKIDLHCNAIDGSQYVLFSTGECLRDDLNNTPLALENNIKTTFNILEWCNADKIIWADFDGDSISDWICHNGSKYKVLISTGKYLHFLNTDNTDTFSDIPQFLSECVEQERIHWKDFNDDGMVDIICFGQKHIYVWISDGKHLRMINDKNAVLHLEGSTEEWCSNKGDIKAIIDFNGDSILDFACRSENGKHQVLLGKCNLEPMSTQACD